MKFKILLLGIGCFLFTGCWNYRELNNLSITTGMSIDKDKDGYSVGMLVSNAQTKEGSQKEGQSSAVVLSGKGDTILGALKDMELTSPKEIYFRHLLVVVISEEVAKDGLEQMLDYLLRESQSRKMFYMVLARDCSAKDTLKILSPLESFPSQTIATNIKETNRLQAIMQQVTFNSFLEDLLEPGKNPYVNSVIIEGSVKKGEKEDNIKQTEQDATIKMDTAGIFDHDKLLGWVSKDENKGINILNNHVDLMYTDFKYQDSPIAITLSSLKSTPKVKITNEIPSIEVTIKGQGYINEINQDLNLEDPKVIKDIEKSASKQIKSLCNKALKVSQEKYQSDVFGYGSMIHKKDWKLWKKMEKNWNKEGFLKLKVNVNVDIQLENKGSLEQSIKEVIHE